MKKSDPRQPSLFDTPTAPPDVRSIRAIHIQQLEEQIVRDLRFARDPLEPQQAFFKDRAARYTVSVSRIEALSDEVYAEEWEQKRVIAAQYVPSFEAFQRKDL